MTDDTDSPSVDERFGSTLNDLHTARAKLWKAASRLALAGEPDGSPPTPVQNQARTVTLGAIAAAKAAIERAERTLNDALRTDDPPKP